jgi:hypothetical protein
LGHISAKEVPESPKNLFMGHLSVLLRHRMLKLIHDSLSVGSDTGPKLSKRVQNPLLKVTAPPNQGQANA